MKVNGIEMIQNIVKDAYISLNIINFCCQVLHGLVDVNEILIYDSITYFWSSPSRTCECKQIITFTIKSIYYILNQTNQFNYKKYTVVVKLYKKAAHYFVLL